MISRAASWNTTENASKSAIHDLLKEGPLTVAVNSENAVWRFYSSGIVLSGYAPTTSLDHDATLVGYDEGSSNGDWARSCYRMSYRQRKFQSCKADYYLWWPDYEDKKNGEKAMYCCKWNYF